MKGAPYRWLADPHERQHVFLGDGPQSLCHMVTRGPHFGAYPEHLKCFWCKRRLRVLKERHKVDLREAP